MNRDSEALLARYLVTGGAGFIGSNLAAGLLARGAEVRIFDDFSTGKRANVEALGGAAEVWEGDLRDGDAVRRAAQGVDGIFHEGALPSVQRSIEDPVSANAVNVGGTLHVILAARDAKVRRVVALSPRPTMARLCAITPEKTLFCSRIST